MSWLRNSLCVFLITSLTACGFTPLYANKRMLSSIEVQNIPGRSGQLLHASLEDLFDPSSSGDTIIFTLAPQLSTQSVPISIESDGTIQRYRILFKTSFTLTDVTTGEVIYSDTVTRTNSYNISDADYSTFVSEQDSIKRGLDELAQEIFLRISAFLSRYEKS
ncbi:MAG: hypothetical protein KDK27_19940 [Leptospiraceae bacterium]|nr:hypothetical protein [Leptospiraceae bacterium]